MNTENNRHISRDRVTLQKYENVISKLINLVYFIGTPIFVFSLDLLLFWCIILLVSRVRLLSLFQKVRPASKYAHVKVGLIELL